MGQCFGGDGEKKPSTTNPQGKDSKTDKKVDAEYKFLLLGSGESGKSTFHKQIRIILGETEFLKKEESLYVNTIYANLLFTIHAAGQYFVKNKIKLTDENEKHMKMCSDLTTQENLLLKGGEVYTEDVHKAVVSIASEKIFMESLAACRSDYHIFDGAEYFFSDLERLKPPKYIPNTQDALRCRRKTTGVIEFTCYPQIDGKGTVAFKLVDVGGQRNERKKWPQFYVGITALIFVVSLNEFDQKCYEDDTTPRMTESRDLFDENTNGPFKDRPCILFLNKDDLFREKIAKTDLSKTFSDYDGGFNYDNGLAFIKKKFLSTNKFAPDRIHCYVTCATDKDAVKRSFDEILKLVSEGKLEVK